MRQHGDLSYMLMHWIRILTSYVRTNVRRHISTASRVPSAVGQDGLRHKNYHEHVTHELAVEGPCEYESGFTKKWLHFGQAWMLGKLNLRTQLCASMTKAMPLPKTICITPKRPEPLRVLSALLHAITHHLLELRRSPSSGPTLMRKT